MTDRTKDKERSTALKPVKDMRKRQPPEVCEICGRAMERDPESGEYYCPDCYYSEDKA